MYHYKLLNVAAQEYQKAAWRAPAPTRKHPISRRPATMQRPCAMRRCGCGS